jgi:hypothetical protein
MKIRLADHVLLASVDEEAVVLNTDNEQYYGLNGTALQMLEGLNDAATVEAAQAALLQQFDVDSDALAHDLHLLIDQLRSRGLIEISDAA